MLLINTVPYNTTLTAINAISGVVYDILQSCVLTFCSHGVWSYPLSSQPPKIKKKKKKGLLSHPEYYFATLIHQFIIKNSCYESKKGT